MAFDQYFAGKSDLSLAEKQEILGKSKVYVNCEPCIMCAAAIRQLGTIRLFSNKSIILLSNRQVEFSRKELFQILLFA
jgi:deoxycytidylate deaminase